MSRVLVVPAAGMGTRLGSAVPKALTMVAGRPMIDHVLSWAVPYCARAVVVAHPAARLSMAAYAASAPLPIDIVVQAQPTGMLDAILLARGAVDATVAERVWICWCDQVLLSQTTAARVAARESGPSAPAVVFPTVVQTPPYIHFERDASGRVCGVRQRREGDVMPERGESDAGFFSLSRAAFLEQLPAFARASGRGQGTGERNFLPFLPWLNLQASSSAVETTVLEAAIEACGINTPDDLAMAESHLRASEQ